MTGLDYNGDQVMDNPEAGILKPQDSMEEQKFTGQSDNDNDDDDD